MAVTLLTLAVMAALCVTSHGRIFNIDPSDCAFYQPLYSTSRQVVPPAGISWVSGLTRSVPNNHPCGRQGVLKVTPTARSTRMRIRFGIFNSTAWSAYVGDSNTGNGWGGDSSTSQGFAAEVHTFGKHLYIYGNVHITLAPPVAALRLANYFDVCPVVWDLNITKNTEVNTDHPTNVEMTTDPYLRGSAFRQIDDQMFRYDELYVGINRVGGSGGRVGFGACELCVSFY